MVFTDEKVLQRKIKKLRLSVAGQVPGTHCEFSCKKDDRNDFLRLHSTFSVLFQDKYSCQKTAKGQKSEAKPHHAKKQSL